MYLTKCSDYRPHELADTSAMSRGEWLACRRQGIGGSDAAAVLGISPFRTARDLYFDKLGFPIEAGEENWVALEMGRLLEPLAAGQNILVDRQSPVTLYVTGLCFCAEKRVSRWGC